MVLSSPACFMIGCQAPLIARGLCNRHYKQWKLGKIPLPEIPAFQAVCSQCQLVFIPHRYRTEKYCSHVCRGLAWLERHPERRKQAALAYWKRNRDKAREQLQQWRKRHPAKVRAQTARRNKERMAETSRQWRLANPYRARLVSQTRRARKQAAQAPGVRISWQAIVARSRGLCGICGKKVKDNEGSFDHILPLAQGGAHAEYNLQVAHRLCNMRKSAWGVAQLTLAIEPL